jgi:pimeloyl-ACP methyl ester carboxylesterase
MEPLTGATQARELHRLLAALDVEGPYIMVGHSYGGMVSREFSALYPSEVVGMVLIDASSDPEIPVYDRLHAGPWLDGTVLPAPDRRIDIHATVRQLEHAPPLDSLPLIVVTAGVLEDQWLRTVPMLEAHAQTRLANLSTNAIHVVDRGVGHFIPERDPAIVLAAVGATLQAAQSHTELQGVGTPSKQSSPRSALPATRHIIRTPSAELSRRRPPRAVVARLLGRKP